MGNTFIALPAAVGISGAGAWVDASSLGGLKDIVVAGSLVGQVVIEISNEASPTGGSPIATIQNAGNAQWLGAALWMRINVVGYQSGTAPVVEVGSTDAGATGANLPCPLVNGTGADVDVSALGPVKTITVTGAFNGPITIEYSEDGTNFTALKTFLQPGQFTKAFAAAEMRCKRQGVPTVNPGTPVVDVAGVNDDTVTPSFFNPVVQRYVATGGETDFNITLSTPRATDQYSVFPTLTGVSKLVDLDCPDVLAGDRTTTQFRVVTSAALTAGDVIEFLIAG